jgi:hypothetical protein
MDIRSHNVEHHGSVLRYAEEISACIHFIIRERGEVLN